MILSSPINSPNFVGKLIFFQHVIIMSGTLLDRLPIRCKKKKKKNETTLKGSKKTLSTVT